MTELLDKIRQMTEIELQKVMWAIAARYEEAYPQWDVVYLAVHKEPALRRQDFERILREMELDLAWRQKQS